MENTENKVRALLAQGSEHEKLDYKRSLKIEEKHDEIEITKDIAAMLSSGGGSLLIGADDTGIPDSSFTDELFEKFDETKLRGKLKKFINEPFDVRVSGTKIDGNNFVLIECGEYSEGFVIMKAIGQYNDGLKDKIVFKPGDVFVRHGSASEIWQQHDIKRIINSQVSKAKAEWIKDYSSLMMSKNGANPNVNSLETLRDEVKKLKKLINGDGLNQSEIKISMDKISFIAIKAIKDKNDELFEASIKALNDSYNLGFGLDGRWLLNKAFNPVELWYEILIHITLIGGVCIEYKRYDLAKLITLQKIDGDEAPYYSTWYRHAFTMSARANYTPRDSSNEARSYLSAPTAIFKGDPEYRELLDWDPEDGITFLVRFDFLANLFIIDSAQSTDSTNWYPSFGYYNKNRITKMLKEVLLDKNLRTTLFDSKEQNLAYAIEEMEKLAVIESAHYWRAGRWGEELDSFLQNSQPF